MKNIIIGTKNPHKQEKLSWIVEGYYNPQIINDLETAPETGTDFLSIAKEKAIFYSKKYKGLAISTDGGAIIPGLPTWDPIHTKRFANTDEERINKLLKLMSDKENRTVEWHESIAIANNGKIIFSDSAKAMDGQLSKEFNPEFYKPGIWLCSITYFPEFNNKNFFELNEEELKLSEDSWQKLKNSFIKFKKTEPV